MLRKLAIAALRLYTGIALVVLNVIVALILLNACASLVLSWGQQPPNRPAVPAQEVVLAGAFPALAPDQIRRLIEETGRFSYVFEPYTLFRDRPRQGTYLTLDSAGFRHSSNQAPWPPSPGHLNVFVFGGSTTFGWLLPDQQTIPSYLQAEIVALTGGPVAVYNFGRTNYIATQERILFSQLLLEGYKPDIAIFIDGCNDTYYMDGVPAFTESFERLVDGRLPSPLTRFALYRAASRLRSKVAPRRAPQPIPDSSRIARRRAQLADGVVARYAANKELTTAMARAFGVTPVFVWQPVPGFRYDPGDHPPAQSAAWRLSSMPDIYNRMEARLRFPENAADVDGSFIWCADIQIGGTEPAYLDLVHYTPSMSRRVAQCIAREAHTRGLLRHRRDSGSNVN